jgi:hypothetical protein
VKRSFDCPETEVPCERGACKNGVLCAIRQEESARELGNYWGEFSKSAVDRQMHELAARDVERAYRIKYRKAIGVALLHDKCIEILGRRHDHYARQAVQTLRFVKALGLWRKPLGLLLALTLSGTASAQSLCVDGHPAPRRAHVTYGGFPPRHGYERDHCRPLGLGGADDAGNVRYEPMAEARIKDADEQVAIGNFCAGIWTLAQARAWLAGRWPCK